MVLKHEVIAYTMSHSVLFEEERLSVTVKPLALKKRHFVHSIPGMYVRFHLNFDSLPSRHVSLILPVSSIHSGSTDPLQRGQYSLLSHGFLVHDPLNAFSSFVPSPEKDPVYLTILPRTWAGSIRLNEYFGGEKHLYGNHRIATDALTENRKYVPGDDPRRINWKLYGHTQELFSRDNEKEPPPRGKVFLCIDTSVDSALFPQEILVIDYVARYTAALIEEFLRSDIFADILIPGSSLFPLNEENGKAFLASLAPRAQQEQFSLEQLQGEKILLVTLPHTTGCSMATGRLLETIKNQAYVHILAPPDKSIKPESSVKRLFVKGIPEKTQPLSSRAMQPLAMACATHSLHKGARHARIVAL